MSDGKLGAMRRLCLALLGSGLASILVAVPLWHVIRWDTSGCGRPCDPGERLPFAGIAIGLTLFGIVAVLLGLAIVLGGFIAWVRALDARERAASRIAR